MLLLGCVSGFAQSPVNQWVFSPENIDITTVKDLGRKRGRPAARPDGANSKTRRRSTSTERTRTSSWPRKDESQVAAQVCKLTAEAWVAVNSPAEWGGIVGSLQDNGSFEKGWVLGYNNDKFNFALSTGGDLTYLNASDLVSRPAAGITWSAPMMDR